MSNNFYSSTDVYTDNENYGLSSRIYNDDSDTSDYFTKNSSTPTTRISTSTSTSRENIKLNGNNKNNSKVLYMLIFLAIFFMSLCLILFICILTVGKNNNENENYRMATKKGIMGLEYKYMEVKKDEFDSTTSIIEGTIFLESDKLIGKEFQEFLSDDETKSSVYIHNLESSVDGSSAHDCKAECVCGNNGNRRVAAVYPIFQTIMGFSIAYVLSVFAKNAVEQCNYYFDSSEDESKCNVDENTMDCEERKQIEWDCDGTCIYTSNGVKSYYPKYVKDITANTEDEAKIIAKKYLEAFCQELVSKEEIVTSTPVDYFVTFCSPASAKPTDSWSS